MSRTKPNCELEWPVWSIVCLDPRMPIRSRGTTYDEAVSRMRRLAELGVSGLTIVTNFVAERIESRLTASQLFDQRLSAIEDGEGEDLETTIEYGRLAGYDGDQIAEMIERAKNPPADKGENADTAEMKPWDPTPQQMMGM